MTRIIALAALAAAVVAIVFVAAPGFALRGLQAGARDGDVHALAELIDYGAVRTGLQAEFAPARAVPPPQLWQDPFGALSRAFEVPRAPPQDVDRFLTPSGLHALIGDPKFFPPVRHWGPNRVRFAAGPRQETLLTFQRRGFLTWRLVQLHVPKRPPQEVGQARAR